MKMGNVGFYGLVDTGASISLCTTDLLGPEHVLDIHNLANVRGVSGNYLKVLGKTTVDCDIAGKSFTFNVTVVEKMADTVFIMGRDFLEHYGCIINYRKLTLSIDNLSVPLLKAYQGKQLKSPISLHCSYTYEIPAYSACNITCHLRRKHDRQNGKLYVTTSGVLESGQKLASNLLIPNGMLNTDRGSTNVQIFNMSDKPVQMFKNKKIGSLVTFHSYELNTLNQQYQLSNSNTENTMHGPRNFESKDEINAAVNKIDELCSNSVYIAPTATVNSTATPKSCSTSPPTEYNVSATRQDSKFKRWQNNVAELHKILGIDDLENISALEKHQVKNLVSDFRDIFAESDDDMSTTDLAEQEIVLKDETPVRCKYYNVPLSLKSKAEQEVKRLMDLRIIEPSSSTYHSPSFVMLKPDGSLRLLTDFRVLNSKILRTYAPVPALQDLVAMWKGCKFYTTLDFQKGFFQTSLAEKSRKYTATSLPGIAFFQYLKSPMGLSSSPGFFQSVVEKLLMGLKQSRCVAFLDDILSGSPDFEHHMTGLRAIFERIKDSKMLLKASKCKIFRGSLRYLGHILSSKGIETCPEKVESLNKMAPPKNVKGVKSFLGLSGFYRRFIKDYAKIVEPLSRMTKKGANFDWNKEVEQAWLTIKEKLVSRPILAHPDLTKDYHLIFDASSYAIGGILCQKESDGELHPISYGSSILSEAQRKWSTVQKELYSLVHFCEKFENYLLNSKFHAVTDNKALLHLETFKNAKNDRLWRWFESLQKFDFTISYCPSNKNPSDALSRLPKSNDTLIDTLPPCAEVDRSREAHEINVVKNLNNISHNSPKSALVQPPVTNSIISFTNKTLETAQNDDITLTTVKSWLLNNSKPENSRSLTQDLKIYYNSYDRLIILENVLCRSWDQKTSEKPIWLACVPDSLQEEVIRACHDPPESGHFCAVKTLDRIRNSFYFPKVDIKTRLYVGACEICIKKRRPHKNLKAPIQNFTGTCPGDIVFMDIMEALPPVHGYSSVLIIIDSFTKWPECVPLHSTKAEYVARALLNSWVSRQGVMTQLHSDRGRNVDTAGILKALYKMLGIEKSANFAYRPQTDGTAERMIGTLKTVLWKYCQENPFNWVNCLDQVLFAYRTSVHSATGFSPFFLDKGRLPRLPMHILMGTDVKSILGKNYSEVAHNLYHKLREAYALANENIKTRQISSKKQYNTDLNVQSFIEGEWVYVWKPAPKHCNYRKFYNHWRGPFEIVQKITTHSYKIKLSDNKFDVVHMELLKLAPPNSNSPGNTHLPYDFADENPLHREEMVSRDTCNDHENSEPYAGGHTDYDSESNDGIVVIPSSPERRYPSRLRTQRIPYQHTS